ncbi:serine O-acetyltransferase [Pseudarthrobacter sulfonivorans]|uniref:serine O-acetyltransferase n=1 Tax=Pseudarthrobacter sulfonivorans TaxID=121292 RepID=UPI0037CB8365
MVLRNVTLGELRPDAAQAGQRYPVVGDDCMIGTGATILGGITVGSNVRIGAHSLVLSNLPSNVTAVGTPATEVRRAEQL